MQTVIVMLNGGVKELLNYLSAHVITCLVPAFFIAGAMAVLVTKGAVIKYFGVQAKRWVAYGVLRYPVCCSRSVLVRCCPFAGIYSLGAGLGRRNFYAGPAINILAIALTGASGLHRGSQGVRPFFFHCHRNNHVGLFVKTSRSD